VTDTAFRDARALFRGKLIDLTRARSSRRV